MHYDGDYGSEQFWLDVVSLASFGLCVIWWIGR